MHTRLTIVVLLALATIAAAQPPQRVVEILDAKDLAKAEYALSQKTGDELARAKVASAEQQATARFKEFLAGKTTVDFLLTAQATLMEARLGIAKTQNDKEVALQEYWEASWACYQISKSKYEAGSIPITQFAQVATQLLDAEQRLVTLRGK
jgi:outer membrane protein TolC